MILLLTPGVPLLLALALAARPASAALRRLVPWAPLPALATSWLMTPGIAATVPWILQGSEFGLDSTGRLFLFFSSVIWLAAGLTVRSWVGARDVRFMIVFLLVMSGSLGLIVARDLLSFYLFFTLMSFGSYALVVHDRSQRARHAGRVYIAFVLAGDMMIFAALVMIAQESGGEILFETARAGLPNAPSRHAAMALLALGFGVKAGFPGVHVTLPLIYRAAPGPAGVVLAGALINAGLLGWLRLLPVGAGGAPGWAGLFLTAGTFAAFYGVMIGLLQRRPRVVLAYSSISQMGIMTAALGAALGTLDPQGTLLAAVVLYALHHAFAKSALFLGGELARHAGARRRRWLVPGLVLPALALTGAPLTTGMLAKETLKKSLHAGVPQPEIAGLLAVFEAALPWMSFATTLLVARFLWLVRARHRRAPTPASAPVGAPSGAPTGAPVGAWALLVSMSLVAAWLVHGDAAPADLWAPATVWSVSWPVLLGVAVAALAAVPRVRGWLSRLPAVPPGDVLVGWMALARLVLSGWRMLTRRLAPGLRRRLEAAAFAVARDRGWARIAMWEARLLSWPVALTLLLLAVLGAWLLLPG